MERDGLKGRGREKEKKDGEERSGEKKRRDEDGERE